jgi:hypothetical protein
VTPGRPARRLRSGRRVPLPFRLALAGVAALSGSGCDLRFTGPYQGEPADLLAHLRILESGPGEFTYSAHLMPGRDREGQIRQVEDEALVILGARLSPVTVNAEGVRSYGHAWSLPPGEPFPELRLRAPTLESVGGGEPGYPFGPCARSDPADQSVSPGDTLRFEVSCSHSGDDLRHIEWELEVRRRDSGGLVLYLHSNTRPPPGIEVPAEWLVQPGDPELDLLLTVTRILVWNDDPGRDYRVALTVRWAFPWTIRWEDREGADAGAPDPPGVTLGPA